MSGVCYIPHNVLSTYDVPGAAPGSEGPTVTQTVPGTPVLGQEKRNVSAGRTHALTAQPAQPACAPAHCKTSLADGLAPLRSRRLPETV